MSLFGEQGEWFEISEDLWRDPKTQPKKLKLCADASVPQPFVEELKRAGIPIRTASEDDLVSHSDNDILAWAKRSKRVLVTLDRDFWNDSKFALQSVPGVIFVDVAPDDIDGALRSFGLVYGTFAISYSLDWWEGMMARATPEGYVLKMRTWEGRVSRYAIKLAAGKVFARELTQEESS